METRHPVGGPFGREFTAFVIIAELMRPEIGKPGKFCEQFLQRQSTWEHATHFQHKLSKKPQQSWVSSFSLDFTRYIGQLWTYMGVSSAHPGTLNRTPLTIYASAVHGWVDMWLYSSTEEGVFRTDGCEQPHTVGVDKIPPGGGGATTHWLSMRVGAGTLQCRITRWIDQVARYDRQSANCPLSSCDAVRCSSAVYIQNAGPHRVHLLRPD